MTSKAWANHNSRQGRRYVTAVLLLLSAVAMLVGCQGVSAGGNNQQQIQVGTLSVAGTASFGNVKPGSNANLGFNATNTGTATLSIKNAAISSKYFAMTAPSLPITIAAGQTVALNLEFSPDAPGTFNATMTLTSDASDASANVALTGTGASSAGMLAVNPTTLSAGNVTDGSSGTASGSLVASGTNVTVTAVSSNNSAFTVSGLPLPVTISAGQSVPFTVTFSPQSAGAASATLTFTSDASPATTQASATGTGTALQTHTVNLSWNASTSSNISGYNIYRAVYTSSCGSFGRINSLLNTGTLYTDSTVANGSSYCYAATAVDTSNQESGYSNIVLGVQIPAN
jgi:hypothetical protein